MIYMSYGDGNSHCGGQDSSAYIRYKVEPIITYISGIEEILRHTVQKTLHRDTKGICIQSQIVGITQVIIGMPTDSPQGGELFLGGVQSDMWDQTGVPHVSDKF